MLPLRGPRALRPALLAPALLLGIAGCSDPTEDYCAALTDEQATLERLAEGADEPGSQAVPDSVAVFERLRDEAPDDVRDEWTTYVIAWQELAAALDRAGVDASVFGEERPEGVDEDELDAVRDAAAKLRSRPVVDAAGGIEQHASDVCGVQLGGGGL